MGTQRKARLAAIVAGIGGMALIAPCAAFAQKAMGHVAVAPAGGAAMHRMPTTGFRATHRAAGRAVTHVQAPISQRADAIGTTGFGFGGSSTDLQGLLNITPSLGFNWEHVNALNQDLAIKALIDPVTELEVAQAERLARLSGGAFTGGAYILSGGYYVPAETGENEEAADQQPQAAEQQPAPAAQPQIIVLQQAPPQQAGEANAANANVTNEEAAPSPEVPDEGQFILVLRGGKEVQAVAFTHVKDKIVYITTDGGRRTIPMSQLDADATVRVNQERGTPLQLPL